MKAAIVVLALVLGGCAGVQKYPGCTMLLQHHDGEKKTCMFRTQCPAPDVDRCIPDDLLEQIMQQTEEDDAVPQWEI